MKESSSNFCDKNFWTINLTIRLHGSLCTARKFRIAGPDYLPGFSPNCQHTSNWACRDLLRLFDVGCLGSVQENPTTSYVWKDRWMMDQFHSSYRWSMNGSSMSQTGESIRNLNGLRWSESLQLPLSRRLHFFWLCLIFFWFHLFHVISFVLCYFICFDFIWFRNLGSLIYIDLWVFRDL